MVKYEHVSMTEFLSVIFLGVLFIVLTCSLSLPSYTVPRSFHLVQYRTATETLAHSIPSRILT